MSWRKDWCIVLEEMPLYSNCCYSCSFEPEIIKIGWWSHKMYSNNIPNSQESTTILNACTKKSRNLLITPCISTIINWINLQQITLKSAGIHSICKRNYQLISYLFIYLWILLFPNFLLQMPKRKIHCREHWRKTESRHLHWTQDQRTDVW